MDHGALLSGGDWSGKNQGEERRDEELGGWKGEGREEEEERGEGKELGEGGKGGRGERGERKRGEEELVEWRGKEEERRVEREGLLPYHQWCQT